MILQRPRIARLASRVSLPLRLVDVAKLSAFGRYEAFGDEANVLVVNNLAVLKFRPAMNKLIDMSNEFSANLAAMAAKCASAPLSCLMMLFSISVFLFTVHSH
jgi:hypothetical protein